MANVTYYAEYHNPDQSITTGILLLTSEGTAHFLNETLGTWQTLTAADVPHVVRMGACALADGQLAADQAHTGGVVGWVIARNTEQVKTRKAA